MDLKKGTDMTNTKDSATLLVDGDLDAACGGYVKIAGIDGLHQSVNSFDLTGKRDIGTGTRQAAGDTVPVEDLALNYEEIKWTY